MLFTRTRRAVRNAKGDFEPTKLIGGLPPVQLRDTILGTDSCAGAQDKGLHRTEHDLMREGEEKERRQRKNENIGRNTYSLKKNLCSKPTQNKQKYSCTSMQCFNVLSVLMDPQLIHIYFKLHYNGI